MSFNYNPSVSVTWFLGWLLILNTCYALIKTFDKSSSIDNNKNQYFSIIPIDPPSFKRMLCVGLLLQVIQLLTFYTIPGSLIGMPIVQASLPFDIFFFLMGIASGEHNWFSPSSAFESSGRKVHTGSIMFICGWALSMVLAYMGDGCKMFNIPGSTEKLTELNAIQTIVSIYLGLLFALLGGGFCFFMSFSLMDLFRSKFNFDSPRLKFLSKYAYTVYIIHPFVLNLIGSLWLSILNGCFDLGIKFIDGSRTSNTILKDDSWLWLSFIVISFFSVLGSWIMACMIKNFLLITIPKTKFVL